MDAAHAVGAVHAVPTGPLYATLLILHVLCAVVGFGATVLTGVQAARARRGPSSATADGVRRYFRPGANWAGRALYGVPVFGFALIGDSGHAFGAGDGFVVLGLGLWLVATALAEVLVWPGERRIQEAIGAGWTEPDRGGPFDRLCRRVALTGAVLGVVFLAAVVIMVGKP
jgi:uncharacterized membrane protein